MSYTETHLDSLNINYLTQEQYDTALANGEINENEIYLTEIEDADFIKGVYFNFTFSNKTSGMYTQTLPITITDDYELIGNMPVGIHVSGNAPTTITDRSITYSNGSYILTYYLYNPNNFTGTLAVRGMILFKKKNSISIPVVSEQATDYIIEQGTDGIWTYRKWNSGVSECWGRWSGTMTHYAQANGFYAYNHADLAFPSNLFAAATPIVNTNVEIGSGFAIPGTNLGRTATKMNLYALASSSGSQTCTFDISAKGRWK